MEEIFSRLWTNLLDRIGGPMTFRLILQPCMALIFGFRDGLKDARAGSPAFLWAIFSGTSNRGQLLKDGWKAVTKVFVLAVLIDVIYQIMVLHWFFPLESLIVAVFLAILPYFLIRGPVNRIARWRSRR